MCICSFVSAVNLYEFLPALREFDFYLIVELRGEKMSFFTLLPVFSPALFVRTVNEGYFHNSCVVMRHFRQSNLFCYSVKHNKGNICFAWSVMMQLEVTGFCCLSWNWLKFCWISSYVYKYSRTTLPALLHHAGDLLSKFAVSATFNSSACFTLVWCMYFQYNSLCSQAKI